MCLFVRLSLRRNYVIVYNVFKLAEGKSGGGGMRGNGEKKLGVKLQGRQWREEGRNGGGETEGRGDEEVPMFINASS